MNGDPWRRAAAIAATAALLSSSPVAWSAARESFDLAVPAPPSPVAIDGRQWLVYELHLTNFSRESLRILKVDVLDDSGPVQSFEGDGLVNRMGLVGTARPDLQPLRPGERAYIYMELPARSPPPRALRHRVHFDGGGETGEVTGAPIAVAARTGAALGPPLRGGPWAAVYAWEWPRGHRRVFYTVEGRARLPGRFAIDWVRKDERDRSARGDADIVKNSLGYGADVLAVADARVAAMRGDVAEATRVSANPKHPLDEAAGNYVALDLGGGRFAIYEHLKPGSIRVKTGDRVTRGQVIGSLGFTGDSTEPHLHFHVADHPSPLAGEGLPFEFEKFRAHVTGDIHERERPAPNMLLSFD